VAIYLAATLITEGQFSIGMLFAYLAYQDQFIGRAGGLVSIYFQFKMLRLHFERLSDIVLTEPEQLTHLVSEEDSDASDVNMPVTWANKDLFTGPMAVTFTDVAFKYSELAPDTLKDLSFSTANSNCTVIVGRSGIGKTTIMKMILGIYKPSSGQILINNVPLEQIEVAQLRENVACVLQDDSLFQGSIGENIAFFDSEVDLEWVEQCARTACVHDDIKKTVMGYQTLVGDMGSTLSAGQKQRVLIARALYRKPKILLLDEATSDLDVATEQLLNQNLAKLDMHRIYIAHRPQTIKFGDQVVEVK
jgi:ATP-binding cassette subfamily B protein RaxB